MVPRRFALKVDARREEISYEGRNEECLVWRTRVLAARILHGERQGHDGVTYKWLNESLNVDVAHDAALELCSALRAACRGLPTAPGQVITRSPA